MQLLYWWLVFVGPVVACKNGLNIFLLPWSCPTIIALFENLQVLLLTLCLRFPLLLFICSYLISHIISDNYILLYVFGLVSYYILCFIFEAIMHNILHWLVHLPDFGHSNVLMLLPLLCMCSFPLLSSHVSCVISPHQNMFDLILSGTLKYWTCYCSSSNPLQNKDSHLTAFHAMMWVCMHLY